MPKVKKTKSRTRGLGIFGIQAKLLLLSSFAAFILVVMAAYIAYGLYSISISTRAITENEIPLTRGITGALLAMQEGKLALETALSIDEFSRIGEIASKEASLNDSVILFDIYLAAITWGSESEAFRKSDGGLNFAEWNRMNLSRDLTIKRPPEEQVQLAGVTDIYFGGFANNAFKAFSSHKKFLRLQAGDRNVEALTAQKATQEFTNSASRFSGLAIESLSRIVKASNASAVESAKIIEETQRDVWRNLFLIFSIGIFVFSYASVVFVRKWIVGPVWSLMDVAQKIAAGNLTIRAEVRGRDEVSMLAHAFNKMADRLAEYPLKLEKTVQERTRSLTRLNQTLKTINRESEKRNRALDKVAKALVKRDLEISGIRRKQEDQLIELDKVAKTLVRRDMDLLRANDELLELDRAKSHFVSVAAHQLRTPLSVIKWTFRMLLSGDFGKINKEQRDVIQKGYDVNEGTIRLVSNLLDVARVESGRFSYSFRTVDIEKIIKEVVEMNAPHAKERKIDVTISKAKGAAAKIPSTKADETALRMVVQNLLSNAINYTLPGGKIEVVCKKEGKFIEVSVKDTGIGIPKHEMGRLFTKFFRGDKVVRMQTSGTGLGLFIAKNIITAHKGEIGVESEEGKGSTFWFRIPIK